MGLIGKVSDKLTGSTHKAQPSAHTQPDYDHKTGITTASSTAGQTGTQPTGMTGNHPTSSVTGSKDASRDDGRLRSLKLDERDLSSAKGEHTVKHAAPVVAEHVHDRYEHVDKTRVEELREKTEVTQTIQPVYDEVKHRATREQVDHGLEVRALLHLEIFKFCLRGISTLASVDSIAMLYMGHRCMNMATEVLTAMLRSSWLASGNRLPSSTDQPMTKRLSRQACALMLMYTNAPTW